MFIHYSHHNIITNILTCKYCPPPTLGAPERKSTPNPLESQANSITLPDDV